MTANIFKGSMPAFYDRYLGAVVFARYADETAARVAAFAPLRVLETAAGTGIVTAALARALGSDARIVATDLSQPMLDFAAAKDLGAHVAFRVADAQALPFDDGSFDAVVCQFGVMFFPDKHQAFREARRVLVANGRFLFSVWDTFEENELPRISEEALAELFPDDPPTFSRRVPYGYNDVPAIEADLQAAGFADVTVEVVAKHITAASAMEYAIGSCQGGPNRGEIEARDPDAIERATEAVARAIERQLGGGPISARSRAIIFTASG